MSLGNDNRKLCLDLLSAESEEAVISLLKYAGYWNDDTVWRAFGDNENNWSQIGNQQGHPVAAMVEKLVNSIDAVLMRECQERGISPESSKAPQSITDALKTFFDIQNGNLANIDSTTRSQLAKNNIGFMATGRKDNPNYIVFDQGEGQTPLTMPDTLLSLSKSNKLRIPFVQGKFNMGGTGALPYCGKHNLQLVISRRCPDILDSDDSTESYWGFTIVRRQEPSQGARSSIFTYLAPDNEILTFDSDGLCLPHGYEDVSRAPKIEWGTVIKMFEYKMTGYRTSIQLNLYDAISLLLPRPGLPVRFYEFRNYRQNSPEATMAGLHVRLQDDRNKNVEKGFPKSYRMQVMGESMSLNIYAFREGRDKNYRKNEGIIFMINGQTHGSFSKRFFSRHRVKMSYIADSILVLVDATSISARAREDLFMNSRDRLRRGELYSAIEAELERIIREDPSLKALREQRRREAIQDKISDAKPLKEILDKILKSSPSLEALFITGKDLSNPFKSRAVDVKSEEEFTGKYTPTFFRLMKRYRKSNERPINRRQFRVQFETDAVNDYLEREIDSGSFELYSDSRQVSDYSLNLHNGVATLNVALPENVKVGDRLDYNARLSDELLLEPERFVNEFDIRIIKAVSSVSGGGKRVPPAGNGVGDRIQPDRMALPKVFEVREEEWGKYEFNKYSALSVKGTGDDTYDYFINMDNLYLNVELKALARDEKPKLLQSKFKYAMVLIGLAILKETTKNEDNPEELVAKFTSIVAPVILPMIDTLGDLNID